MENDPSITIHVLPRNDATGKYLVEAELDDGSFFSGGQLFIDPEKLLANILDGPAYGLELYQALFNGPILRAYDRILGRAGALPDGVVRVRLWISDEAAELQAISWERLYHTYKGQKFALGTSAQTPFSRYTGLEIAEVPPLTERPVRMLVVISNPSDLPEGFSPVDVDHELDVIQNALGDLTQSNDLDVSFMPGFCGISGDRKTQFIQEGYHIIQGESSLDNILRAMQGIHILHFVGHGVFRRRETTGEGTAALYLEDDQGGLDVALDQEIIEKLAQADPLPRLIFLSACDSAKRGPDSTHPFVGLAPKLIKTGVPCVIAMQDIVPVNLVRQLTSDFYRQLLADGEVDKAMNRARLFLFTQKDVDWAIPVLFMRLANGRLFAPDPVLSAMEAIQEQFQSDLERGGFMPIPIEVAHLSGDLDLKRLQRVGQEPLPAVDLVDFSLELFARRREEKNTGKRNQGAFVIIAGIPGSSKSTQLRRLGLITSQESLKNQSRSLILPILINLAGFASARSGGRNPIEVLILNFLRDFWNNLEWEALELLLDNENGPVLRILVDGSDELPEALRYEAWQDLQAFSRNSRHEIILAVDVGYYDPNLIKNASDLLVIQPLSERKLEQFLKGLKDQAGINLYSVLRVKQLFDLAAIPWLLISMLHQAQNGIYPISRMHVLKNWVDEAISEIPTRNGMRYCAAPTLDALGWAFQTRRTRKLPIQDAFNVMGTVRSNREYSLEDLFDELVKAKLLMQEGHTAMGFNYPAVQAFCAARYIFSQESRENPLDDITAELGRLSRLRWWGDVLVLVSRMQPDPNGLLRMISYGINLASSEQLYLIVRCLVENRGRMIEPFLENQVIEALLHEMDILYERRLSHRTRAVVALGQLRQPKTIPNLARVAIEPIRTNWRGDMTLEYSSVRMAAAIALQNMMSRYAQIIEDASPKLFKLLQLWIDQEVPALSKWLHSEDHGAQGIAAFALGDINSDESVGQLIDAFLDADTPSATSWSVTDALVLVNPLTALQKAVLPLLDKSLAEKQGLSTRTWKGRAHWYERLAYLIGKIRAQVPETANFLDRCLYDFVDIQIKGKAIQTLGWLNQSQYKPLFEQIAMGDFQHIKVRESLEAWEKIYLRQKAIESLGRIGDGDTLRILQQSRENWPIELAEAYYWMSEEISDRLISEDRV